jgi:hypothetical protein
MSPVRALRGRWISGFFAFVFAFCLGEALLPEVCDGDAGRASIVATGTEPGQAPTDRAPGHGGPHFCHCAHTNGILSVMPLPSVVNVERHVAPLAMTPTAPPSHTLQPDSRPPIA